MNDKRYFLKKHAIQKSIKDILLYLELSKSKLLKLFEVKGNLENVRTLFEYYPFS